MGKVRIVYKPDKTVVVIHYAPKSALSYEEAMAKAMKGDLKDLPYDDTEDTALPASREDRDGWEGEKGKGITVNKAKAQAIKEAVVVAQKQKAMADLGMTQKDIDNIKKLDTKP